MTGHPIARAPIDLPEGDVVREVAVVTDDDACVHEDAAEMTDVEPAADTDVTRDVDAIADRVVVQEQHQRLSRSQGTPGVARAHAYSRSSTV